MLVLFLLERNGSYRVCFLQGKTNLKKIAKNTWKKAIRNPVQVPVAPEGLLLLNSS